MSALPIGYGMGLLVAAQLGPMSLFLIRSVLRGSLATGLAIGAGIPVVDTLYAAAGAAGPGAGLAAARAGVGGGARRRGAGGCGRRLADRVRCRRRARARGARRPHAAQRVPRAAGSGGR